MIVLQALEEANRVYERVVGVSEIAEEISTKDQSRLKGAYSNNLSIIIGKIIGLLITRGLAFSPSTSNRRRFYGSARVLDPNTARPPEVRSRRSRVLELVNEVVQAHARAVRNADVIEYAKSSELVKDLSENDINHDVLSLVETGELAVVGRVRGENKGLNLYLPSHLDASLYKLAQPLTWLDEVAKTIEALWAERVEEAKIKGARPKPLTTGDVRARVVNSPFHTQREMKKDPQILVDAVKSLSESRDPLLRKIKRRGQKTLLWVPIGVADEDVDFGAFYSNDAERMGAAVERSVLRLGRPVTVKDIQDEVDEDFALQPANSSSIFQALAYAARETFDAYDGKGRRKRLTRRVYKIGRAGPNTYYHMDDAPEARSFVEFRRIELDWSELRADEQLEALEVVSLSSVARGRAMLLAHEVKSLQRDVAELLNATEMDGTTRREAERLNEHIEQVGSATHNWLSAHNLNDQSIPTGDVSTVIPRWTAVEFLETLKPLYPIVENLTSAQKFITLMGDRVRRIPNPEFEYRFSADSRVASEFFYDRTDALLYAAKQWGGPECCLQAMLASRELGILRDARFIFPALDASNFENRLAGIACVAFLWSEEGNSRLRRILNSDPDPGVRQSALWAYGFAGGKGAREMLVEKARNDQNNRVREFASQALEADGESWWKM
jgi:hypothetical protein